MKNIIKFLTVLVFASCSVESEQDEAKYDEFSESTETKLELSSQPVTLDIESPINCLDSSIIDTFYVSGDGLSHSEYIFNDGTKFKTIGFSDISDYFESYGTYQILNDTLLILKYDKQVRYEKFVKQISEGKGKIVTGKIIEEKKSDKIDSMFIDYSGAAAIICLYSKMYDDDKNLISKYGKFKCKRK